MAAPSTKCRCGVALYFRFAWTNASQPVSVSSAIMLCAKQLTDRRSAISYCCSGTTRRPGLRLTSMCNIKAAPESGLSAQYLVLVRRKEGAAVLEPKKCWSFGYSQDVMRTKQMRIGCSGPSKNDDMRLYNGRLSRLM